MNFPNIREETRSTRVKFRDQIEGIREDLEKVRKEVGADVIAFYLACDEFLPDYLRCLAAPGAAYEEACSHFRLRPLAPTLKAIDFFERASDDPLCSGNEPRVVALIDRLQNPIFGDFVTREGIVSRGRIIDRDLDTGKETALLTVNYREPRSMSQWLSFAPYLEAAFRDLLERVALIKRGLQELSATLKPAFQRMLEVTDLSRLDSLPTSAEQLDEFLEKAIEPLREDGKGSGWCGTIHLLDDIGRNLLLKAWVGEPVVPPIVRHRIDRGEGVISWVALRKQAIRIRDLPPSPFDKIHVPYLPGVRSQLAVPMMTRGRLLGTLSLESTEPNIFSLQTVGYLTRVACLVASTLLLAKYEEVEYDRDCYLAAIYEHEAQRPPLDSSLTIEDLMAMTATSVPISR
jgi:putative methionine-R-sulfoxide reductase with GAF domain